MAAQKRKAQSQRGIVIFLAVVLVSGGLLWSTGNMKNPFNVIPNIANLITNGYQPKGGNNATQTNAQAGKGATNATQTAGKEADNTKSATGDKQASATTGGAPMAASAAPAPAPKTGGGKDNNTIQWNQFGNVLFNFWYLAATTASLILLGQLISLVATVSKKLRRSAGPVAARS